jgi:hypothetical protein
MAAIGGRGRVELGHAVPALDDIPFGHVPFLSPDSFLQHIYPIADQKAIESSYQGIPEGGARDRCMAKSNHLWYICGNGGYHDRKKIGKRTE